MTDAPATRYEEIAAYLRTLVTAGQSGDRLPSDAELCERFAVSRMTARQAVQILASEGLLERRRGSGTFIATRRALRTLGSPLSFTESMRRRGMSTASQLIEKGPILPADHEIDALGLRPGERAYLLERLRLADGTAMAIERVVMPLELVADLHDDLDSGSLHAAFEHAGHVPSRALAEVTARKATRREARLLELTQTGVVLSERRTIFDQDDAPLERTETCYAADRYSFEAILYRDEDQ